MSNFLKDIINEAFESKKQQRFFYAKAEDKSEPKKERQKWGEWAKEFASKTNFKKLPEVAEDHDVNDNPTELYNFTAIAFIDVNKRIKENLDSIQEVQEFANKMAHLKHAEALQIERFNDNGLVKKSYFIYDQDNDKWEKVKSLPYHEFHKPEGEIEEIVDELGNIARSKIPTDAPTKGITQKKTTDQVVKTAYNSMGAYGTQGAQGYTRYWGEGEITKGKLIEDIMGESDLEGTLGYEATLGQDASKEEAERYFKKELGMSDAETEERLAAMGYDDELPDEKVRLIENPKKFMGDYIESILAKRNLDDDIVTKDGESKDINPIILKQIKSLKSSIDSNQISLKDLVKLLKDNE